MEAELREREWVYVEIFMESPYYKNDKRYEEGCKHFRKAILKWQIDVWKKCGKRWEDLKKYAFTRLPSGKLQVYK